MTVDEVFYFIIIIVIITVTKIFIAIIRSEEHTSELQSQFRISYAVFCLKKKKTTQQTLLQHI